MHHDVDIVKTEYPFEPQYMDVDGGRMHYVDVGSGPTVVMVHGTPVWSFVYRRLIRSLSRTHRVIAMDHIGFGKSDKPVRWTYTPEAHAANFSKLVTTLKLDPFTLVVNDFGGPIGLSHAIAQPSSVRSLVMFNTWMWGTKGTPAEKIGRIMSTPLGRFLYLQLNISPRVLLKTLFADRAMLTPSLHRAYLSVFPDANSRHGLWHLARSLNASSDWFASLWEKRSELANKPALILWGERDPAFKLEALTRWRDALPAARVVTYPAGHFLQEERAEEVEREVIAHLATVR